MAIKNIAADQIKKHSIKSTPNTHLIKLCSSKKPLFSIFIFIFFFSSSVSLSSYTHHFFTFTDYTDRHYVFLLCNGILVFLIMNFDSTHGSSSNENQLVVTDEINHHPRMSVVSSAIEPVAAMQEHKEEIKEEDDGIERNVTQVCVIEYCNAVLITQEQIKDQKAEHRLAVVDEQETGESNEAAETEELNKRCAEFIRKTRDRMKLESK